MSEHYQLVLGKNFDNIWILPFQSDGLVEMDPLASSSRLVILACLRSTTTSCGRFHFVGIHKKVSFMYPLRIGREIHRQIFGRNSLRIPICPSPEFHSLHLLYLVHYTITSFIISSCNIYCITAFVIVLSNYWN